MRVSTLIASIAFAVGMTPAVAMAWDFSCSPRTTTEIEVAPPPNIMMMLDRSGSMGNGDRVRSCKVCEDPDGTRYEVTEAADCSPRGIRWEEVRNSFVAEDDPQGFTHTLVFNNLPPASEDLELVIDIRGDSGGTCEFYDIEVDGVSFGEFNPRYNGSQCQWRDTTFTVPATFAADGEVIVTVTASADGNDCGTTNAGCSRRSNCDGVDTFCDNEVEATLGQNPRVYWGTQAWADPCGIENKWEQAVRAIDLLTLEGQSTTPEQAHFGFGYYNQNDARILNDCAPSNHAAIMSSLNPLSPTGATPTALGIRTSALSGCVAGAGRIEIASQTDIVPRNSSNDGYVQTFSFGGLPAGALDATLEVEFWGDFGSSCEFADVIIDGVKVGWVTGNQDCNGRSSPYRATFDIPPSVIADGRINVRFDTRGRNDSSSNPNCSPGDASTNAYCSENGATMRVFVPSNNGKASASILINDGAPTRSLSGRDAYHATIYEACEHRDIANLYVVGLGTGTDEEFNNIVAAAGGTGSCLKDGVEVDPCDDPANWAALRGRCEGSFQTDDGAAMLSALAEITAEIACTYPVDFTNSGRDAVPPDATNEYDYLWVEVLRTDTGTVERAYNVSSPVNPTPGLGWEFASSERKFVRMSQGYCNLINSGNIRVVETQLACLCQQTEGADCSVPGAAALGVCPEGTWTCVEGIDICEPDPDCCTNNEPCNTGLPGVCAVGRIVCTETGPICERVVDPSAEICDGLDNDCDGIVDELDGSNCTVEGQTGRCAVGVRTCSGASETCEPLYGPMPEICNGLDDDCDGTTDNITESWSKQQFDNITLSPAQRSLTCDLRNLCSCPSGEDDHAGGTFDEYIDNWDPVCLCGDGVEWDEGAAAADTDMDGLGEGGCASGDGGTVPGLFLTLLGLFFFRRRRDVA